MVLVALVVGAGLYAGATAVEDLLAEDDDVPFEGEVVATNTTTHLDRVGRPTAVGEVVNGLDDPIDEIAVTVTFRREDGGTDTVNGTAELATVPSGGRSPFVVRLSNRSARVESVDATVTYRVAADRPSGALAVVEHRTVDRSGSQVSLAGQVENRGDAAVDAHVVATFYDEAGSVVGVRSVPTDPPRLTAGETGEFAIRFRTLGNVPSRAAEVDRYDLALRAGSPDGDDAAASDADA
ncbi:MAG: FxLYD domain-containing protein [Halobacteriales archaeon]